MERTKKIRFMNNPLGTEARVQANSIIDADFPLANIFKDGRFSVTRFVGTFPITASNQVIYIDDGSPLSANITTGDYTAAALATEIATQLNSVSSNWSCTYSTTTYKFTISRSAGTDTLRVSQTTNAIWDAIGYTGVIDQAAAEADEQRNHTKEYLEFDLGNNANEIGFFGLMSPVSSVFPVSESGTIELLASNIPDWVTPERTIAVTRTDAGAFAFLDDGEMQYRYFRLEITDRLNANGPQYDFSAIYLGTYTTLTNNRNINRGFTKAYQDLSEIFQAESGATYANIRPRYLELDSCTIGFMERADRQALEQLFFDFGIHKPFWVSFDPLEKTSEIEELTRYVYFRDAPSFNHFKDDIYSMSFALRDAL